jgi:hypothetical protein
MLRAMSSQDDLNALLNGAVDVATDLLATDSEFAPFALAIQAEDGEIFHLEPDEEDMDLDAQQVAAALAGGLREAANEGRWRATAIVADVTLEDEEGEAVTAAIHVSLEHADGEPVTAVVPYEIGDENVELGDLMAEPGESVVFVERLQN